MIIARTSWPGRKRSFQCSPTGCAIKAPEDGQGAGFPVSCGHAASLARLPFPRSGRVQARLAGHDGPGRLMPMSLHSVGTM